MNNKIELSGFLKLGSLSVINTIVSKGSFFIINLLLLKILGFELFGNYSLLKNTIDTFIGFVLLGIGSAITIEVAQSNDSRYDLYAIQISGILYILMTSLLVIIASKLFSFSLFGWYSPKLIYEVLFVIVFAISSINNSILYGLQKYKLLIINAIISILPAILMMVYGAKISGYTGALKGYVYYYIIVFFISSYQVFICIKSIDRSPGVNNYKISFDDLIIRFKKLILMSLPLGLAALMVGPVILKSNYMLFNSFNGDKELGVFESLNQWKNIAILIPAALSQVSFPIFAQNINKSKEDKILALKEIGVKVLKINLVIICCLIILVPIIYFILLRGDFEVIKDNYFSLIILLLSTPIITLTNISGYFINGNNKLWIGFFINLIWAVIFLICSYFMITILNYGNFGLSIAYFLSYLALIIFNFLYIKYLK